MSKAKLGRPKDEREIPNHYTSMQAMAGHLGIPLSQIRAAKRAGCSAFESNRIHTLELLRHIHKSDASDGGIEWDEIGKKERALKTRIERQNLEGKLITRADAEDFLGKLAQHVPQIIDRHFNELPMKLEGLRSPQIRAELSKVTIDVCAALKEPFK